MLFILNCIEDTLEKREPMSVIDMMYNSWDEAATFTVDISQPYVLVDEPFNGVFMRTSHSDGIFDRGDNFNILSVGIKLPLGFEFSESQVDKQPSFLWFIREEDAPNASFSLNPPSIYIPFPNYEMSVGTFINVEESTSNFRIKSFMILLRISMYNVDPALDGEVFKVQPFMKIEHTKETN